jgi:predicted Abi (CAAX) family protease
LCLSAVPARLLIEPSERGRSHYKSKTEMLPFLSLFSLLPFDLLARRLTHAFLTIPDFTDWLVVALLVLVYSAIALPIGFWSGFLKVDVQTSGPIIAGVLAGCLLTPGLTEEVFFRVLMLPHAFENASGLMLWFWGCSSLVLFVAYHPLNALTFYPVGRSTFIRKMGLKPRPFRTALC